MRYVYKQHASRHAPKRPQKCRIGNVCRIGSEMLSELTILSPFGQAYIALHRCYKLLPLTVDADGEAA